MDFTKSFEIVLQERFNAVLVLADAITFDHRRDIIAFSIRSRVPTFHSYPEEAFDGAFAAYGPSLGDQYRRAACYVDKVLKGALPSSLPVDQPTRFEFVINMNTARSIGIAIPPQVLARVDKLIE
jgi:putative ABC transport system substrate-binding protein